MHKLNYEQFMTEFFKKDDKIIVKARALQRYLISLNKEIQDSKMRIKQLEEEKLWQKAKVDRLEQNGSFYLDLEA